MDKIYNHKTGRYVKANGVIGKKLLKAVPESRIVIRISFKLELVRVRLNLFFHIDDSNTTMENLTEQLNNLKVSDTQRDNEVNKMSDSYFWAIIRQSDMTNYRIRANFLLQKFGTSLACNRFDVGNCFEYNVRQLLTENGLKVEELPNAKRVDLRIENYDSLSVKYTSSGNIKLHNSLGQNHDMSLTKTLIITPQYMYLISQELLSSIGIDFKDYIVNKGDGLELQRGLLIQLHKKKYEFICPAKISHDKKTCANIQCSRIIWEHVLNECA